MKKNREKAQEEMMEEITRQMEQHLERLCEQEEPEDFLKAYRVDPEEEGGDRFLLYVYPLWEAEICGDWDAFYRLWKKGYCFHGRTKEMILDIYESSGLFEGEHRQVDYDTYKNIFLKNIFKSGFLEKSFIEKKDDATEQICRELEDYILDEEADLTQFYEFLRPYLQENPTYIPYFPRLAEHIADAP